MLSLENNLHHHKQIVCRDAMLYAVSRIHLHLIFFAATGYQFSNPCITHHSIEKFRLCRSLGIHEIFWSIIHTFYTRYAVCM